MPLQRFQIYDIIVDIIPGVLFGFLFLIVAAPSSTLSDTSVGMLGIGLAIILVSFSYVIGRFIHGISAITHSALMSIGISVKSSINRRLRYFRSNRYESLRNRINQVIPPNQTFEQHIREAVNPASPYTVKTALAYNYITAVNSEYDIELSKLDESKFLQEYKNFSYTLLYNEDVLYRKYETLTTAFRSIYTLFLILFIMYFATAYIDLDYKFYPTIWTDYVEANPTESAIIIGAMLLLTFVFFYQWRKFSHRRGWALLYDSLRKINSLSDND